MKPREWIEDVQGKPWVDRSYGPDSYDCWGLVIDYFKRVLEIELPEVDGYLTGVDFAQGMAEVLNTGTFENCGKDSGLLFTRFIGDDATHVGVITDGRVVHAMGAPESGGQVYNHTIKHIERLFANDRLEFWQCRQ